MVEQKKRFPAVKIKIGEILKGNPIIETMTNDAGTPVEKFRFLELGTQQIQRVNIIANIIDKFISEGEKTFGSLTIDDASGQIKLKVFGEDTQKFQELNQGDTIIAIGLIRSYNNEVYILPEIIKKADPRYLLIRKLETDKKPFTTSNPIQNPTTSMPTPQQTNQSTEVSNKEATIENPLGESIEDKQEGSNGPKQKIINLIKSGEEEGGVDIEQIILKLKDVSPNEINKEVTKLLEEGIIYEPRPGRVRYLG